MQFYNYQKHGHYAMECYLKDKVEAQLALKDNNDSKYVLLMVKTKLNQDKFTLWNPDT